MGCNVACPNIPGKQIVNWGLDDPTGKNDPVFPGCHPKDRKEYTAVQRNGVVIREKKRKNLQRKVVTAMPELPEIEAIKRVLEPQIQGFAIEQVTVSRPEVIAHPAADEFCRRINGQVFSGIQRRGKFLILCMESGDRIILHLRMTGCLLVMPADYPEEKHTHLVFHLSGGRELRFSDTRRFGRLWLLRLGEADTYSGMEKLGVEPFAPGFSGEYLAARLGKRKKAIKECPA